MSLRRLLISLLLILGVSIAPLAAAVAPTVATPASATESVDGTRLDLAVLGDDDGGEAALGYTWSVVSKPAGAAVTVGVNGTNAAKSWGHLELIAGRRPVRERRAGSVYYATGGHEPALPLSHQPATRPRPPSPRITQDHPGSPRIT